MTALLQIVVKDFYFRAKITPQQSAFVLLASEASGCQFCDLTFHKKLSAG
jgi:hypothetical protein